MTRKGRFIMFAVICCKHLERYMGHLLLCATLVLAWTQATPTISTFCMPLSGTVHGTI